MTFEVKLPSSLSVALTPDIASNLSPTVIVLSTTPFNTGASFAALASTLITRFAVVVKPSLSVTEYVNSYVPALFTSTLPSTVIFEVKSPSSLSVALTPDIGSNLSPTVIVLLLTPVSFGAVF